MLKQCLEIKARGCCRHVFLVLLHNSINTLNSSIVIACATSCNVNYSGSTHIRVQIDGLKLV